MRFRNLISAFSKGRIVILSTHIVSDVEFIAEKILVMKSGQIIHYGRPGEITSEIQGQVWECVVPTECADRYVAELNVSNLRNDRDGLTVLRVISGEKPMRNARLVSPNLEDLYLYYFQEQPTSGRHRPGRDFSEDISGPAPGRKAFTGYEESGAYGESGAHGESEGRGFGLRSCRTSEADRVPEEGELVGYGRDRHQKGGDGR